MTKEIIDNKEVTIYTWPNPSFPFRLYFNHEKCRIFIIENISHNFVWLKECKNDIRESDYFISITGWYASEHVANLSRLVIQYLNLDPERFIVLCNDYKELKNYLHCGFNSSILLNHNAFLDENIYTILEETRIYDAILIARRSPFKRLHLANKINNLALVTGNINYSTTPETVPVPPHVNEDNKRLNQPEIVKIINQSKCGLCLSEIEGACFSSSEYLLCGIPVVSTQSLGGRDIWYDEDNSIICSNTDDSVLESVLKIKNKKYNSNKIRKKHILLSLYFRNSFIDQLEKIFKKHNIKNIDSQKFFLENFYNKMRQSIPYKQVVSYFKGANT